ncbi:MAG: 3-oxoacyl-ACP synthase III family protein [Owenweeksia sp.]|nr:3-oxoacyl-ACP synthase III family protein [Owenweeksia sp.]
MNVEIIGTGSYVPDKLVANSDFENHDFYHASGEKIDQDLKLTIDKFKDITGIRERRYAREDQQASDLGTMAGRRAIEDAGIDPESLDGILVAHNFGNIPHGKSQSDLVPSLATRIKHDLGIKDPNCIAFDLLYGCPGWLQVMITAYTYIKAQEGKRYLIIGAETLSRNLDQYDRDSMIFSDGAGAAVVEARESPIKKGILATTSQTYTQQEAYFLNYDVSHNPAAEQTTRYIKMKGRKIFEFGLNYVPLAMKKCLDESGVALDEVKKILIHQANEKMDEAILKRFYKLYKRKAPEGIMPMSIHTLGNSSVATIPTLLDSLRKGQMEGHSLAEGDVILMASVGAGMSINAVTYRI